MITRILKMPDTAVFHVAGVRLAIETGVSLRGHPRVQEGEATASAADDHAATDASDGAEDPKGTVRGAKDAGRPKAGGIFRRDSQDLAHAAGLSFEISLARWLHWAHGSTSCARPERWS